MKFDIGQMTLSVVLLSITNALEYLLKVDCACYEFKAPIEFVCREKDHCLVLIYNNQLYSSSSQGFIW